MKNILDELAAGGQLVFKPSRGMVLLSGRDGASFLQRLSTNNIEHLCASAPLRTSFANNRGRLIDSCALWQVAPDRILLVSSRQDANHLIDWLSAFHFIEDLSIADASDEYDFSYLLQCSKTSWEIPRAITCGRAYFSSGLSIDIFGVLDHKGKGDSIDAAHWQTLRIAALMPAWPDEISDRFMPQEVNLLDSIADEKGCYIGQEVIAKAQTYQKNQKILCGVSLSEEAFLRARTGGLVRSPDQRLGEITSSAAHFLPGEVNALVSVCTRPSSAIAAADIMESGPFLEKAPDFCPRLLDVQKHSH